MMNLRLSILLQLRRVHRLNRRRKKKPSSNQTDSRLCSNSARTISNRLTQRLSNLGIIQWFRILSTSERPACSQVRIVIPKSTNSCRRGKQISNKGTLRLTTAQSSSQTWRHSETRNRFIPNRPGT